MQSATKAFLNTPTQPDKHRADSSHSSPQQAVQTQVPKGEPFGDRKTLEQRSTTPVATDEPKPELKTPTKNNLAPKTGWGESVTALSAKQALTKIYSLSEQAWGEKLGDGVSAKVVKVTINGKDYAIKLPTCSPQSVTEENAYKTHKGEICGLKISPHTNIVQTHALLLFNEETQKYHLINDISQIPEDEQGKCRVRACIQELAKGKELFDLLSEGSLPKGVKTAVHIGLQVINALQHLHSYGLIHRDLKPANILCASANSDIKLIDFGTMKSVALDNTTNTFCGSFDYIAPEVFQGTAYNHTVDNVSLGWLLFELATGKAFYSEKDEWSAARDRCAYSQKNHTERQKILITECKNDFPGRDKLMDIVSLLTGSNSGERMSLSDATTALEALQQQVLEAQQSS